MTSGSRLAEAKALLTRLIAFETVSDSSNLPLIDFVEGYLREHGLDVPSSCETGTCGTCRTKLLAGEADHRDLVLAEHERKDTIMICVSRTRGGDITIDR